MGRLRSVLSGVVRRVAQRVAQDELFEKPGERVRPTPLPPRAPVPPATASSAPAPAPPATAPAKPEKTEKTATTKPPRKANKAAPTLPTRGCVRGGVELALLAHGPGPRPRVVNHWATWCVPCVEEFPHLIAAEARLRGKVDFLGLSWDLFDPRGDEDDIVDHVARFAEGNGVTWPSVLLTCSPESFFQKLGLPSRQVPQTWVFSAEGEVLARFDGALDAAATQRLIDLFEGS